VELLPASSPCKSFVRDVKGALQHVIPPAGQASLAYNESMHPRSWRRIGRELVLPGLLLLLLVVLAALQFRWTGEVSRAEAQRLEAGLHTSLARFCDDFDEELVHVFRTFSVSSGPELVDAAADWREQSRYPEIVDGLFLVGRGGAGGLELSKLEPGGGFSPVEWPRELEPFRERFERFEDAPRGGRFLPPFPFTTGGTLALVVPAPPPSPMGERERSRSDGIVATVVKLREDGFRERLLPELVANTFGTHDAMDYDVVVLDESRNVVFSSGEDAADVLRAPDASSRLFAIGRGLFGRRRGPERRPHGGPPPGRGLAPTPGLGAGAGAGPGAGPGSGPDRSPAGFREMERELVEGRWTVYVRHHAGSLEDAVGRVRRRNLAVGFGILSILGASIVLVTVSARRATDLSERKMEFVAGVSHELRTPLAVIRSAAQNLGDGSVTGADQTKRYGTLIEAQGRRLEDLVEQVLELAGVESRKRPSRREPVRLSDIVGAAVSDCEHAASGNNVAVSVASASGDTFVLGDPDALRRAVSNLVANAIKHGGGDGGVAVAVAITRREREREVAVEISDRGPGIPKSEQSHLFEAFFRGSRARANQVPGSGLGLSVVRQIAREHGGRVEVSSTPGTGSRFSLVLPEAVEAS
jgi:signal transduction histidine kinase